MERIQNEPAEPSANDFSDDIHHAADDGHTARSHHADDDDWVQAGAREGVNCDDYCNDAKNESCNIGNADE